MSLNNTVVSKRITWSTGDDLIPRLAEVADFWEEAFDEFNEVTFERDTEEGIFYVYLSENMYIRFDCNTTVKMSFYLGNEVCTFYQTINASASGGYSGYMVYFRTKYGIAFCFNNSDIVNVSDYSNFKSVYVSQEVPILFTNISTGTSNTIYIMSSKHTSIETYAETNFLLTTSLSNQKFAMANAYCFGGSMHIDIPHFFKILCSYNSTTKGKLRVQDKYVICFHRYALEFDPEDTTGV